MTKQIELPRDMMHSKPDKNPGKETDPVKLNCLLDSNDIESYLTKFECIMKVHEIDVARLSYKLAPQLTGKVQQAYAALHLVEAVVSLCQSGNTTPL